MIIPQHFWFLSVLCFIFKKTAYGASPNISFNETDSCECGKANAVASRIVGGEETEPNEYPWMVAIFYGGLMYCGGSLINDRYILTAGHCIKWAKKKKISVILGLHDRVLAETQKQGGLFLEVEDLIVHEKFQSLDFHDVEDIGLIKLKNPVKYNEKMSTVCLARKTDETYAEKTAQITGWGRISQSEGPSRYLQEANVKVISNEECRKAPVLGKHILDSMLCAYRDKVDACQGDSGGPMTFETESGRVEQIGVVSWGIGCAKEGMPGVYTRVTSYLPWIASHTKDGIYCKHHL